MCLQMVDVTADAFSDYVDSERHDVVVLVHSPWDARSRAASRAVFAVSGDTEAGPLAQSLSETQPRSPTGGEREREERGVRCDRSKLCRALDRGVLNAVCLCMLC